MGDDLANNWGTCLCTITKSDKRTLKANSDLLLMDEFRRLVSNHFKNEFELQRICQDGSTANLLAIIDATNGDTSACLCAAGCYVSADNSFLQNLSTSDFHLNSSLCLVVPPDKINDKFALQHVIGLPYYIKGCLTERELQKYEDDCLRSLHTKLLLLRAKGQPAKCILLELILAGNGATLSNRALDKIAVLCKKHNLSLIIDEVMTGGRTGTMLHLEQKPIEFINCVSHVTLGKWVTLGMILSATNSYFLKINKSKNQRKATNIPRTPSTTLEVCDAIPIWKKVAELLPQTDSRRDHVLKQIKCSAEEAWGEGLLIFAPIQNKTMKNLKCRYLPLIEPTSIHVSTSSYRNKITKYYINQCIMEACLAWSHVYETLIHKFDCDTDDKYYLIILKHLCLRRILNAEDVVLLREEIYQEVWNDIPSSSKVGEILTRFKNAGFLQYTMCGNKRLRKWIVTKDVFF